MKLEKNVLGYCERFRETIGNYEAERFDVNNHYFMDDHKIKSPIEQILYMALALVLKTSGLEDKGPEESANGNIFVDGVKIFPQFKINKYIADFKVAYQRSDLKGLHKTIDKSVIVECDSQKYHETSEPHRRYEKERDRFMQKKGYKVFRYTGSEICKDPLRIATEIIAYVADKDEDDISTSYINYV